LLTILGVWKLLGGIAILVPGFSRLKEWAYAGAFFVYMGAVVSGAVRGRDDPGTYIWPPIIFGVITLASSECARPAESSAGAFRGGQSRRRPLSTPRRRFRGNRWPDRRRPLPDADFGSGAANVGTQHSHDSSSVWAMKSQ
jgi:hypothetical protein